MSKIQLNADWFELSIVLTKSEEIPKAVVLIDRESGNISSFPSKSLDGQAQGNFVVIGEKELVDDLSDKEEQTKQMLKLMIKYDLWPKGGLVRCEFPQHLQPECPKCGNSGRFSDSYCSKCGSELEEKEKMISPREIYERLIKED